MTSWTASAIALQIGSNVLTVTARDGAGNTAMTTLTVTRRDITAPTVTITSPTANPTYTTSASSITLGGTAFDDVGVTQVAWTNSQSGGTATGTTSWTASGIALQIGSNVLTVTARDAAGNTATATLTVTLTSSFTFTDDPLTAEDTIVKALHITELRAAIDSLRVAGGLAPFAWTDPTLAPGIAAKAVHLIELRAALNQAYQALAKTPPAYADLAVMAGQTIITTVHLNELRSAVRGLR